MSQKCVNCDAFVPENAKFCPECGTAQKRKKSPKARAGESVSSKQKSTPAKGYNLLYIVAIISIIVVGMYGYRFFVPPEQPNTSPQQQNVNQSQQPAMDQNRLEELQARLDANPDGVQENLELGNFLFDNGQYDHAIEHYQKVLEKDPDNADVIVDLGVSHFNLQNYEKAKTYFNEALDVNPEHPNALYNLGVVSAQLGDMDNMMAAWEKLIEVAPQSSAAQRAQRMIDQVQGTTSNN